MIRKLLLLLVILLITQISIAQQAEILGNCFYDNTQNRIVIRLAIRNSTASNVNLEYVAQRWGLQYNDAAVTYTGYKSYAYNNGDESSGLNDASFLAFMGPDTGPSPAIDGSPDSRIALIAPIATGGTKTLQVRYFNRSTSDCDNVFSIPPNQYRIVVDFYFTLVNPLLISYYNLNQPAYGFGTTDFIAQFFTKNNGGHDGILEGPKKEIAVTIIRQGQANNPFQPFDLNNCNSANNVDPIAVSGDNINFITPINGVLSGKVQALSAIEKNNTVQLDWKVENNELVDRYELERKDENGEFKTIAVVLSDNNHKTTAYRFNDKITARELQLYYRVKTMGLDQMVTYSDIKTIKLKSVQHPNIKVFPNPSSDAIRIELPIANGNYVCRIYNSEGRMVRVETVAYLNATIKINDFVNGNYFAELYHVQSGKRFYSQFTKQ